MDLVVEIYKCTKNFPREEMYGLTNQLRRAAVSVASNIAEGKGRSSDKELCQFLDHARGSLYEVQTQLQIAEKLGFLSKTESHNPSANAAETGRLLNGLIRRIRSSTAA
jgi:four helix bundle protein